jgi:hypothetical protein
MLLIQDNLKLPCLGMLIKVLKPKEYNGEQSQVKLSQQALQNIMKENLLYLTQEISLNP